MSKIEWTGMTWNPVVGCSDASTGCKFCYARTMSHRLASMPATADKYHSLTEKVNGRIKWTGHIRTVPAELHSKKLKRKKPTMFFVNSMSDTFHPDVPVSFIHDMFNVMRSHPQHTFQVLTKRPERILSVFPQSEKHFPRNVWVGTSAENQTQYEERVGHLRYIPAPVRFLSIEPLLGAIDLKYDKLFHGFEGEDIYPPNWVIVGGESGHNPRKMNPDWVRSIRDQCSERNIPFFFKQWGGRNKKAAGRELDGKVYKQMP